MLRSESLDTQVESYTQNFERLRLAFFKKTNLINCLLESIKHNENLISIIYEDSNYFCSANAVIQ